MFCVNYKIKHPKRRLMKKLVKRFLKYIRNPLNEFGFMTVTIQKTFSDLPANVCIDDNGWWINLGNTKIILFQTNNKNNRDFNKMLPMSIEEEPQILVKNEKIELENFEIEEIKYFVKKYHKQILQIGNGKIGVIKFLEILKEKEFFYESFQKNA
jgi:hypothetical protein